MVKEYIPVILTNFKLEKCHKCTILMQLTRANETKLYSVNISTQVIAP